VRASRGRRVQDEIQIWWKIMIGRFIGLSIGAVNLLPEAYSPLQRINLQGFIQYGSACDHFAGCLDANIVQGNDYVFSLSVSKEDGTEIDYAAITDVIWTVSDQTGILIQKSVLIGGITIEVGSIDAVFEETDTAILSGVYTHKILVYTGDSAATVLKNSNFEIPTIFSRGN